MPPSKEQLEHFSLDKKKNFCPSCASLVESECNPIELERDEWKAAAEAALARVNLLSDCWFRTLYSLNHALKHVNLRHGRDELQFALDTGTALYKEATAPAKVEMEEPTTCTPAGETEP